MTNPNETREREPGTRPDGEAAPPQTIDPEPGGGIANDEGLSDERPQADPEVPALGDWDKRRGPDPTEDVDRS